MNRQCTAIRVTSSVFVFIIVGCATAPSNTASYSATSNSTASPPPDVHDCTLISTGSPGRYQCGDKTYTSFDLTKMQHDAAQQQSAGR